MSGRSTESGSIAYSRNPRWPPWRLMNLTPSELFYRLLAAAVCGAAIGLNRDLHGKSAGFRTLALVSLGTSLAALIIGQSSGNDANATARLLQGVLTGIGFLGAGVIFRPGHKQVSGLTTAAAIWFTAVLGVACGTGLYILSLLSLAMALSLLVIGKYIEKGLETLLNKRRGADDDSANSKRNRPPPP